MQICNIFAKSSKKLNIIRYCVNFNAFSLKKLDKNKEFKFNLIVAKDDVALNKKCRRFCVIRKIY